MLGDLTTPGRGESDRLMAALAEGLTAEGMQVVGAVQRKLERPGEARCDMGLCVLSGSGVWRISQRLGPLARGCRPDPEGLESAVGEVAAALASGTVAELVIVHKSGKQEIDGRGFRPVIAAALLRDLPVLTAVDAKSLPAFLAFAGGIAEPVAAEPEALRRWCFDRIRRPRSAPHNVTA